MTDNMWAGLIIIFVGCLIMWATIIGYSINTKITIIIGLYFILTGCSLILQWDKLAALLIAIPLGLLWLGLGLGIVTQPFRYCLKKEVRYRRAVFDRKYKGNEYYSLECVLELDGKEYRLISKDTYTLSHINKKYTEDSGMKVWGHRRRPNEFMVKRFQGVFFGMVLTFMGIVALYMVVYVIIYM